MSEAEQDDADRRFEAVERLRIKAEAYVALFGPPGQPTAYGRIVLDDLDGFCKTWSETLHITSTGAIDPYGSLYRDGKKAVALRIREFLNWSTTDASIPGGLSPDGR